MTWHESSISSWLDFLEFVERTKVHKDELVWYFRGQAQVGWGLTPSLIRHFGDAKLEREKAHGIERGIYRHFLSQAHLYLKPGILMKLTEIIGWWIVMQRYSCPTRLLDWTQSPYVALYFAVEQSADRDGALWAFPAPPLETLMTKQHGVLRHEDEEIFTGTFEAVYPILSTLHTERSIAQQSTFTICTDIFGDHGEIISKAFAGQEDRYPLHKIVIPSSLKHEFLSRLRVMNITASSLFPGIDGLGREAAEYIRVRVWTG